MSAVQCMFSLLGTRVLISLKMERKKIAWFDANTCTRNMINIKIDSKYKSK